MLPDPRGGHNKHSFNKDFFKSWTEKMAYVLGFIYADGAVEDVRKSSRTCYLAITSVDKSILVKIRRCMGASHPLYFRKIRKLFFKKQNKTYTCRSAHTLRIGSMEMYGDLINLGLTPRKSLDVEFPEIPNAYLSHFIRGYFDGDGCLYTSKFQLNRKGRVRVIFTSGSKRFLEKLNEKFRDFLGLSIKKLYPNSFAYQLVYSKEDALKVLDFMYKDTHDKLYLDRKYKKYCQLPLNG